MTKKLVPAARHQNILEWLKDEGALSIQDLELRLNVSHMTIHRDLDILASKGLINKVRGGASPLPESEDHEFTPRLCTMCNGQISRRLEINITLTGGRQITTCCPHCGILVVADNSAVDSALARDFLSGRKVNIYQAFFVVGSDLQLCCEPTILCFAKEMEALKFKRGFSGQVMNFSEAKKILVASHRHI